MRKAGLTLVIAGTVLAVAAGQTPVDAKTQGFLKKIFPAATAFSPKDGNPPHFKAFQNQTLLGYAFWTTELEPLERAYDGPIKIMVGMDPTGVLTGVVVAEHHEPYGDFSIDPPAFSNQFRGKSIRDPFKVGSDVDAVSRATISITSASRAIRNASRRMAKAYLNPEAVK